MYDDVEQDLLRLCDYVWEHHLILNPPDVPTPQARSAADRIESSTTIASGLSLDDGYARLRG